MNTSEDFRERLRSLVEDETLITSIEVTIVRQRMGRNGDAQLPVTHLSEQIRHSDENEMAAYNARLEAWIESRPVAGDSREVELFSQPIVRDVTERIETTLDQLHEPEHLFEGSEGSTVIAENVVETITETDDLEIPDFVYQPHVAARAS